MSETKAAKPPSNAAKANAKPRVLLGDPNGALVRRKIVLFKRLEPGDMISSGNHPLRESPYLEGKVIEIGLGKAIHDDMVRLGARRAQVLGSASGLLSSYDLAGMLFSGAGGGLFGVWLDYLPGWLTPYLLGTMVAGIAFGFVTRVRKRGAELAAEEKWKAAPEHKEYDAIARELAERWIAFSLDVKKDDGFHTEVRVAEGSDEPLRLASVDPRGFIAVPPSFDPEDFLPTEGSGVRYEAVHLSGEVVTRLCDGDRDLPEQYEAAAKDEKPSEPAKSEPAKSEPAKSEPAKSESEPAKSESEPAKSESEPAKSESEPAKSESESEGEGAKSKKAPADA